MDAMLQQGDTADEELLVCAKCCAQFEEQEDLAQHRDRCPLNDPVVVIVANQEDGAPVTLQRVKPTEPGAAFRASDTQGPGAGTPEMQVPRVGATPTNGDCKSSGVTSFPGMGASRSYWSEPRSKDGGSSQPFLTPGGGLNQDRALSPKAGQAPHDASSGGAPPSSPLNIPMILEELRILQQRQIHQMQMTEQICRQVLMLGSLAQPAMPVAASGGPSPTSPVGGSKSMPSFNAIKLNQVPEVAKTMSVPEMPKQAFFQLYNPLGNPFSESSLPVMSSMKPKTPSHFEEKSGHGPSSLTTSSPGQLLSAHTTFPAGILAPQVGMFLGARVVEPVPSLLKQKNGEAAYAESLQERSSGRHKCRFCAKVFGSDSALQIHLRSHTGERPYKCNICGNRFTTRGNLKVHFQRHKDKYPHIQMNPHPVPEHLDYMLNGNGLPYGMSVPPEKSDEEPAEKKPLLSALSATESLTLLSASQTLPSFNKFLLMKPGENSTPLKNINVGTKSKADENTPPADREVPADNGSGRMQLGKLANSLPSWAVLANHFKTSTFPFPYVVDPLGSSETFKLQQLVEKIDKQASSPNQCIICLRVLSCPRALRLHYSQHGGERPFKCKICGRAFSTRGNLKAHFVGHKSSPAAKTQNSCPICQKKFTNAVTLQQHIRMHLGGQIPNGDLPEGAGSKLGNLDESFHEQDFSEEDITDEDSLEASGSENEKQQGPVDSEVSSIGGEATTSIPKKDPVDMDFTCDFPLLPPVSTSPPLYTPPAATLSVDASIDMQKGFKSDKLSAISAFVTHPEDEGAEFLEESMEYESMPGLPRPQNTKHKSHLSPRESLQDVAGHACYVCSVPFPTLDSLGQHMKVHSIEGLFQCLICKQRFLEKTSLMSHMLRNHPGASKSPPYTHEKPQAVGTTPPAQTLSMMWPKPLSTITSPVQAPSLLWPKPQALITPLPAQTPSALWPKLQATGTHLPTQAPLELWQKPQAAGTPLPAQAPSELWPRLQAAGTPPPVQVQSEIWPKPQAAITPLPAQSSSDLLSKLHSVGTPPPGHVSSQLWQKTQIERTPSPAQDSSELWPKPHAAITPLPAQAPSELWAKNQATGTHQPPHVTSELWLKPQAALTSSPTQAPSDLWPKPKEELTSLQAHSPSKLQSKPQTEEDSPLPEHDLAELGPRTQAARTPPPAYEQQHQVTQTSLPAPTQTELQPKTQAAGTPPPAEAPSGMWLQAAETPPPVQVPPEQWSKTWALEGNPPCQAPSALEPMAHSEGLPHMVSFLQALPPSCVMSRPVESSSNTHLCSVCQNAFPSHGALEIHERTHTEEKQFSCTMCERAFTTQGNLKVHMSTHAWDDNHVRVAPPQPLEAPATPLLPGPPTQAAPNVPAGEDPVQLAKSGPLSFWNQYTAFLARSSETSTTDPSSPAPPSPHPTGGPGDFSENPQLNADPMSPVAEEK
ncbi:sal-like protein 2 isoform X2 [Ambystoma mexicanum]|uniref:sal-like protein 2 isoform X2 n=1 Tax=Ambystoma mexicanum TaxID=8296 RepID=UPI0037E8D518